MAELGDRSVAEDDAFDNDAVGGIAWLARYKLIFL